MADHGLTFDTDPDGWDIGTCECGWASPPCPSPDEVVGFYTDHLPIGETDDG